MEHLKSQFYLRDVKAEANNLPMGLSEALVSTGQVFGQKLIQKQLREDYEENNKFYEAKREVSCSTTIPVALQREATNQTDRTSSRTAYQAWR